MPWVSQENACWLHPCLHPSKAGQSRAQLSQGADQMQTQSCMCTAVTFSKPHPARHSGPPACRSGRPATLLGMGRCRAGRTCHAACPLLCSNPPLLGMAANPRAFQASLDVLRTDARLPGAGGWALRGPRLHVAGLAAGVGLAAPLKVPPGPLRGPQVGIDASLMLRLPAGMQ